MKLTLQRFLQDDDGTFGILTIGELQLYTVEREWRDNEPNISCVPADDYEMVPHSGKYADTWALVGETVSHYPETSAARSTCVFHVGNRWMDVRGCVAIGTWFGVIKGIRAVVHSRDAMAVFRQALRDTGPHTITIIDSMDSGMA